MSYSVNGSANSTVSSGATVSVNTFSPNATLSLKQIEVFNIKFDYYQFEDAFTNVFYGFEGGSWTTKTGTTYLNGNLPTPPPVFGKFFSSDWYTPTWTSPATNPINILNNITAKNLKFSF